MVSLPSILIVIVLCLLPASRSQRQLATLNQAGLIVLKKETLNRIYNNTYGMSRRMLLHFRPVGHFRSLFKRASERAAAVLAEMTQKGKDR